MDGLLVERFGELFLGVRVDDGAVGTLFLGVLFLALVARTS